MAYCIFYAGMKYKCAKGGYYFYFYIYKIIKFELVFFLIQELVKLSEFNYYCKLSIFYRCIEV